MKFHKTYRLFVFIKPTRFVRPTPGSCTLGTMNVPGLKESPLFVEASTLAPASARPRTRSVTLGFKVTGKSQVSLPGGEGSLALAGPRFTGTDGAFIPVALAAMNPSLAFDR